MKKPDISDENIWTIKSVKKCERLFEQKPEEITVKHVRKLGTYIDVKKGVKNKEEHDKKQLYRAEDLYSKIEKYFEEEKKRKIV